MRARTARSSRITNANGQAALTVVLAALAAGIGYLLSRDLVQNVLGTVISSVLQWVIFAFVAYYVGASLFSTGQTSVTPGQVLRTIGFAQAPKLLLVLGIIPILGWVVGLIVFFWFIAAAIVALREAFEFDTGRAVGTGLVALVVDRHHRRRAERHLRHWVGAVRRAAVGAAGGLLTGVTGCQGDGGPTLPSASAEFDIARG